MAKVQVKFRGRKQGQKGPFQWFNETVEVESKGKVKNEDVVWALYTEYSHIYSIKWAEV